VPATPCHHEHLAGVERIASAVIEGGFGLSPQRSDFDLADGRYRPRQPPHFDAAMSPFHPALTFRLHRPWVGCGAKPEAPVPIVSFCSAPLADIRSIARLGDSSSDPASYPFRKRILSFGIVGHPRRWNVPPKRSRLLQHIPPGEAFDASALGLC
jgi:hypothetical protein